MDEYRLTLQKARELNQLDKFADQQDRWLVENGYSLRPESDTDKCLTTFIKSEKSADQT